MGRSRSWSYLLLLISCIALPAHADSAATQAYTPTDAACPSGGLVRAAGSGTQRLSSQESSYTSARKQSVLPSAWSTYLSNVESHASAHNIQVPDYVSQILGSGQVRDGMTLGVAISGGGYRAAIVGGGMINALDARNTTSIQAGTGGLLQSATYLSGLSGGGWLVSSLTQANFPPIHDFIYGTSSDNSNGESNTFGGILAQNGFIDATTDLITEADYVYDVVSEVRGKMDAGFPVTITDVWARVLARHFVNGTTVNNFFDGDVQHGAGLTWSGVVNAPSFAKLQQPFPILIADSVSANGNQNNDASDGFGVPLSNPIYEMNPYEFGSYDPVLASFIPTRYMGSTSGKCVNGFDQISYVQAVSSNVFNGAETDIVDKLITVLEEFDTDAGSGILAAQIPNPFKNVAPSTFIDSQNDILSLGDGGEDGQEIPFQPLLVKARGVDVVVALDISADGANNMPGGGSLIDSSTRASLFPNSYSFPPVPGSTQEIAQQGLNTRPTFFGCDNAGDAPLIIWLANNAPLGESPQTNSSTWQFTYSSDEIQGILDQSFDIATQGIRVGNQKDPVWPTCLACAVTDRARAKSGIQRSGTCETCMARYCWQS